MDQQTDSQADAPDLMKPADVAAACNVARATVYEWIEAGHLIGYKLGGVTRVTRESFEAFLARGRIDPQPDA